MNVPHDLRGYAVDRKTGIVHTRHAPHARGLTRIYADELPLVLDIPASPCPECYPAPEKPKRTRRTKT